MLLNIRKKIKTKIIRTSAVYGIHDSLNIKKARVVPSLIMRMLNSKKGSDLTIWGNSKVTRDFIYSGDIAKFLKKIAELKNLNQVINFSSGKSTTIRELAKKLNFLLNKDLNLIFDKNGLSSASFRVLNNKEFDKLNLRGINIMSIDEGLKKTIQWYKQNV